MPIDETHDPERCSWVESANGAGCEFPIQNLPFGIFSPRGPKAARRGGIAIGDQVLDVAAFSKIFGFTGMAAQAGAACGEPTLNTLMSLGREHWSALRVALSRALSKEAGWEDRKAKGAGSLSFQEQATLFVPARIGDYTDFYTSIFHATNVGKFFRPDNPLMPNYKWVPIGYHGRASSIIASGTPVTRPRGQLKPPAAEVPVFGACKNLDYETELGFFIGTGNDLGRPIGIREASDHVFGVVLLNDWSARDIQAWEYQPLGPFLAKNFATTISPWIVTMDALEPYRTNAFRRPAGDPAPLPYLSDTDDQAQGGLSIAVEMSLRSEKMRAAGSPPVRLSHGNYRDAYWTLAQMVTHHASSGCNLQPGDLLGTGTLSGDTAESVGSMLELTQRGAKPVGLPTGETRAFIADGDEIIQRGHCSREGYATIGFGEAAGTVLPALA
jgi:fumarylacetoacetase